MLSQNFAAPYRTESGDLIRYASLHGEKGVHFGPGIRKMALKNPSGYVASSLPMNADPALLEANLKDIAARSGAEDVVVLSSEGWSNPGMAKPETFQALASLGVPVEIVMFVRPPVDWFNSGWWQWGVWNGGGLGRWFEEAGHINLLERLRQWDNPEVISRLAIFEISQSPYRCLLGFLGVPLTKFEVADSNVGTNFHLLKHLVAHKKKYGRTTHDPSVEFELNKLLDLPKAPPPFVVPKAMSRAIIARTKKDNLVLLDRIESGNGKLAPSVRTKYLDENAYDRTPYVEAAEALKVDESDAVIGRLIDMVRAK
ncbi:hypothetical protein DYI42_20825 [Vannielia litorea]|nr:hypothetical protein [Vannielia litorea]